MIGSGYYPNGSSLDPSAPFNLPDGPDPVPCTEHEWRDRSLGWMIGKQCAECEAWQCIEDGCEEEAAPGGDGACFMCSFNAYVKMASDAWMEGDKVGYERAMRWIEELVGGVGGIMTHENPDSPKPSTPGEMLVSFTAKVVVVALMAIAALIFVP